MAEILLGGVRVFDASPSLQGAAAVPTATDQVQLVRLGAFTGTGATASGRSEVVDFDPASGNFYVTNAAAERIDVAHLNADGTSSAGVGIDLGGLTDYGGVNSVAVKNGVVAVAYANSVEGQPGYVALFDAATGSLQNLIQVGVLPDNLTFTPDGKKLLVANEGEPVSAVENAEGSVNIIDLSQGAGAATVANTISFASLNGSESALKGQGLALLDGQPAAADIEPEYIAISPDGTRAYVTLQEVNGVAVIDLTDAAADRPLSIQPLGGVDHGLAGNEFDPSDRNGIAIGGYDVIGLLQPDAIASFSVGGATYFITANEGDARVGDGLEDELRVNSNDYDLDPGAYPNGAALENNNQLGRLNVLTNVGDTDGDGDYDQIYTYGGRGVSIFRQNADGSITKVRETGGEFERYIAQNHPELHNGENLEDPDSRSDNKGPEPEGVTVGWVGDRLYAFVTLERVGGVMVYDVTEPAAASFVTFMPATPGDFAPETVKFISAEDSPTGQAMLLTANEASGTTTIYAIASAGDGADALSGGPEGDLLKGLGGNDTLSGLAGDDTLDGGPGADLMRGGAGDDTYIVDSARDRIQESGGGVDTVLTGLDGYRLGAGLENLTLTGGANLSGVGNSAANILTGNGGANDLDGGAGDDTLAGGGGVDTLTGGSGDDSLSGGADADRLEGGSGHDLIDGGAGDDSAAGGSGNDTLVGGAGADTLVGGSGADVFVFAVGSGADVIGDFRLGVDVLDLTAQSAPVYGSVDGDALISFADGASIRLVGVSLGDYLEL